MKYNDKASRDFQERLPKNNYNYEYNNLRSERRKKEKLRLQRELLYKHRIASLSHPLCVVMNTEERTDICVDFDNSCNSRWNTSGRRMYKYKGDFNGFVDYLTKIGDVRILKYKVRLRDFNIDKLLSDS